MCGAACQVCCGATRSQISFDACTGAFKLTTSMRSGSGKSSWRLLSAVFVAALLGMSASSAEVADGQMELPISEFHPGKSFDLTGKWFYKPGYAVGPEEHPEKTMEMQGYVNVPVPQLLNRVRWWL